MSYELRRLNLHSRMSETEIEQQMRGHLLRQWRADWGALGGACDEVEADVEVEDDGEAI